jgi:hypothetical protein
MEDERKKNESRMQDEEAGNGFGSCRGNRFLCRLCSFAKNPKGAGSYRGKERLESAKFTVMSSHAIFFLFFLRKERMWRRSKKKFAAKLPKRATGCGAVVCGAGFET